MKLNNNIQESYCSFEVSNKLWRIGARFVSDKCFTYSEGHPNGAGWYENLKGELSIPRPTHALAIEWIRVNFGIMIWIDILILSSSHGWAWNVLAYKEGKCICNKQQQANSVNMTPQEATEAALLYVLTNLIK